MTVRVDTQAASERARRYKIRHNHAFYGPLKDVRCNCVECQIAGDVVALAARLEAAETARDEIELADEQLREYNAELAHGATANADYLNRCVGAALFHTTRARAALAAGRGEHG